MKNKRHNLNEKLTEYRHRNTVSPFTVATTPLQNMYSTRFFIFRVMYSGVECCGFTCVYVPRGQADFSACPVWIYTQSNTTTTCTVQLSSPKQMLQIKLKFYPIEYIFERPFQQTASTENMFFLAVKITRNDFKYGIFVARIKENLFRIPCGNFNSKKDVENNFFLRGNILYFVLQCFEHHKYRYVQFVTHFLRLQI